MNRRIVRLAAAVLGGLAVVAAMASLVLVVSVGARRPPVGSGAVIPLIAGGIVALVSWYLLADVSAEGDHEDTRATVSCPSCGAEVFREWRLCPYCGGAQNEVSCDASSAGVSAELRGSSNQAG